MLEDEYPDPPKFDLTLSSENESRRTGAHFFVKAVDLKTVYLGILNHAIQGIIVPEIFKDAGEAEIKKIVAGRRRR
jgi:hypothetical protein